MTAPALAQTTLKTFSFSNGTGASTATSFRLNATVGQSLIGTASSSSLKVQAGFQPSAAIDQVPDLDFTSVEINPTLAIRGNNITVFFVLANTGTAKIEGDIVVRSYLSANPTYDAADRELGGPVVVGNVLNAGEQIDESGGLIVGIPADVAPGAYYVVLLADPEGDIAERSETNNAISATVSVLTSDDTTPPVITPFTPGAFENGGTISVTVTDDESVGSVLFFHWRISGGDVDTTNMTASGTSYSVVMQDDWADELGMEGYFIAEDIALNKTALPSSNSFWYRVPDAQKTIPFAAGFNGKTSTYQMFSIPYKPDDDAIANIFEIALGGYKSSDWRMFHFKNGAYLEYPQQFRKIVAGEGYWFNTVIKDFEVKPGSGKMNEANKTTLQHTAGWKQVGNPYPFNISWKDVLGGEERVGLLQFFENGSYVSHDVFKPWTGAFVHADEAISLPIPVTARTNASGRRSDRQLEPDLDAAAWLLPINIRINDMEQVSGVGMHPDARTSKDKFDQITVPRFLDYAEMNTWHEEFFSHQFSTDVVPTTEEQVWTFDVKSNVHDQQGALSWDNTAIASNKSSLLLIDLPAGKWIDMKATGRYTFTQEEGRQIKIIYNRSGEITPGMTLLGEAYPNPFTSEVKIPLLIDEPGLKLVEIYDGFGRLIQRISGNFRHAGIHELTWDGRDANGQQISSGMLYYRLVGDHAYKMKRLIKR
jgi:hypothetical protein